MNRRTVFALVFGVMISSAGAEETKPHANVSAKVPGAPKTFTKAGDNHPGEQYVDRLLKMTPGQREAALRNLPPERRENIERRLAEIGRLPTAQQSRIRARQEMLNSLPPQRQNQVRRAVRQFMDIPEERRAVINQELNRIAPLGEEERRAYMNTEEFRNKFSAREQQMLSNLAEITPPPD